MTIRKRLRASIAALAAAGLLSACVSGVPLPPPESADQEQDYARLYPYYAEICAFSQLEKRPGFGIDLSSGFGGHAGLYLNGVCRQPDIGYPVIQLCDEQKGAPTADGVGISVNAHYRNAEWVAVEGRDLYFRGELKTGEPLTREIYRRLLEKAQSKRIYDAVTFHEDYYEGMPAGFSRQSLKYEISVATDFALKFGRNKFCARIPLSRRQMSEIVDYMNAGNEPYRSGKEEFDWSVLAHNCSHINHNALAAAGLWDVWPMDRFILISAFDFPVPKNEFVNAMRRTNDMPIDDLEAIFEDEPARKLLLKEGRLPTEPGAIADLDVIAAPNEVYDTESRIVFYDDPVIGSYQRDFNAILSEPRYFRLRDNLSYFAALYERILRERKSVTWYLDRGKGRPAEERELFKRFYDAYYDYISRQTRMVAQELATIDKERR